MLWCMDDLLTIGEFSTRCGLSVKKLRSYGAVGVLVPYAVDDVSGYRYYAAAQLGQARTIALLRQARIPLAEIADFLREPTGERIALWQSQLESELAQRRRALEAVRHELAVDATASLPERIEIRRTATTMTNSIASAVTGRGLVRETNQDAVLAEGILYAVADGLGPGGELASGLALETLRTAFAADPSSDGLVRAGRRANEAIWQRASADPELTGMGSTLTALAVLAEDRGGPCIVHIGDSRLYRFREGVLEQLTEDHTVVGAMLRSGELNEEQAGAHPHRHLLTRALGIGPEVATDLIAVECRTGDRLLICTDGLFNDLAAEAISVTLQDAETPAAAAGQLVALAETAGGHDNVGVVVVDID